MNYRYESVFGLCHYGVSVFIKLMYVYGIPLSNFGQNFNENPFVARYKTEVTLVVLATKTIVERS